MDILVTDKELKRELLRKRRECGGDRYDEIWNGVYVMSPSPSVQHQDLVGWLAGILFNVLGMPRRARVYPGLNVSDRQDDWTKNYRVPDIAVIFPDNPATLGENACIGGPDFLIEIVSKGDRSRKKRTFYSKIGVRELLIINRAPWAIELYRLINGTLELVTTSRLDAEEMVISDVVPLTFRLVGTTDEPKIEVSNRENGERWVIK